MPQRANRASKPAKPQPTLKGFFAWAFTEYVSADDQDPGPVAARMIEDWLRRNAKTLADDYGITRDRYNREMGKGASVARMEAHRRHQQAADLHPRGNDRVPSTSEGA